MNHPARTRSRLAVRAVAIVAAVSMLAAGCAVTADDAAGRSGAQPAPSVVVKSAPPEPPLPLAGDTPTDPASASPSASPVEGAGAGATEDGSPLGDLSGYSVVLDPGHGAMVAGQGVPQVPVGRGSDTKPCRVSGTATASGYPEKDFNLDVARRVKKQLVAAGAAVQLTRESDSEHPCADARGKVGNTATTDAWVSIHADGSTNTSLKGYFAIVSDPPLNEAQGEPSLRLAQAILDRLGAAGFAANPSYSGALSRRPDLAGLNVARRPAVMMELGEMKNPGEAAVMASAKGRARYADAVAAGIADYLQR